MAGGLKLLTFNCWHGLDGAGLLRMGELESPERREQRLAWQLEDFIEADADLLFLQEVNPLRIRAPEIASLTRMSVVAQGDLSGVKVFGWGLPANLDSGLALLARPEWNLRKLQGLQLSGPPWGVSLGDLALQTSECRYALFAEITHPILGRLLLVNVHLHHGLETHSSLVNELEELADQGTITWHQQAIVLGEMGKARDRRLGEVQRLLHALDEKRSLYDGVVIAGDLNSDETSPTIQKLRSYGFADVYEGSPNMTWNADANHVNFHQGQAFPIPLPDFGIPSLRRTLHAHMYRQRRLDYIFVSEQLLPSTRQLDLFGAHHDPARMTSDHFGLQVEIRPRV